MIDYSLLPYHMQNGMKDYLEFYHRPGGFLYAVLSNDFMRACEHADDINQQYLFTYARFLFSHAPVGSYGSAKNVEAWLAKGIMLKVSCVKETG